MKNTLITIGRFRSTVLLTIVSVAISALIAFILMNIFRKEDVSFGVSVSIIIPMMVAPVISWYVLGLLMELANEEELQRNYATYDDLTGLLSRRTFFESCDSLVELMKRKNEPLTIAYIDIDMFKNINDSYGHAAGDATIQSLASVLKNITRKSNLAGRVGGDEFILALPYTDFDKSQLVLERVKRACEKNIVRFKKHRIKYTISIGVSSTKGDEAYSLEELIRNSDQALYEAKHFGKNRIFYGHNA